MAEETTSTKNPMVKYLIIGLIAFIGLGALFLFFKQGKSSAQPATVSGVIDYNGLKPTGNEDTEKVKVKILARENGSGQDYRDTNVFVPLKDNAAWEWKNAEVGKNYDIVAELTYTDISVKKTNRVTASAPAQGLILTFNITNEDIENAKKNISGIGNDSSTSTGTSVVSGTIIVQGFIPTGSYINVYGRKAGTTGDFKEAISKIPAKASTTFSYNQAVTGETYEYQAELYDANGNFIGQSSYLTVTAPATGETVRINSSATAPTQKAKISGKVTLNGNIVQNSTVLVLQRKIGETTYQEINRYPANSTVDYVWEDAVAGTTYDITATLQVNEQDAAIGNALTVAAPASNVNLTINTNFTMAAPTQPPTVKCGDPDQTNHFNAQVSVSRVENAKKYYMEIGTSAGASNTFSGELNLNDSARIYIPAESPYFARYAYTMCDDCNLSDSSNWSSWSPTLGFKCPQ